ncbi:phage tail tape measure protein [Hydrogenophaga sp.]|uniref:phage tail tape measure protein n=1 Tax=Hydrogenophaga sp. TaxID=1904254 RepID=UPI003F70E3D9
MANDLRLSVIMQLADRAGAPLRNISKGSKDAAQALKAARDQLKQLDGQQKAIGQFREVRQGLQGTSAQLKAAQNRTRALAQQMQQATAPSKALTREFNAAKREAAQLGERLQRQSTQAQHLRDRLGAAGISTRTLGTHERSLRAQVASTTAEVARRTAALKQQEAAQQRLQQLNARHARHMLHTGMMGGTGLGAMAAGRAGAGAIGGFLGEGVDFEATMSRVQALTRLQKDSADLAALRGQARQLGAATMFSATEAAQGQAFLAMAGFTPNAIRAAMPGLLDMAKAGDIDLGRGADISSNILSAFGIDPKNMGMVADVLTKTFTTSNVNLEMLGDTMSYVGPVARAAGVDLHTVSAMAGLLGNVGIQGQKGGTALRAMLLRLSAPTARAASTIEELGVKTADAHGNVRPVVDLLQEIAAATEKLGSGKRLEVLKDIFGEEPAAAMAELISQAGAGGITKYLAQVRDSQGAAARTAGVMADNMRGNLDELSSAWSDVRIAVNEANSGWLRAAVDSLTGVTNAVGRWAQENPGLVKALSMVAIGLAAAMVVGGGLLVVVAAIAAKFLLLRFLLLQVGIRTGLFSLLLRGGAVALRLVGTVLLWLGRVLLMNPIGLAITGIATAAFLIYRYWGPIKAFFSGMWSSIVLGAQTLWQAFTGLGRQIMDGLIGGISSRLAAVRDAITGVASAAIGWFREKLGIQSPSRVFMAAGEHIGQGAAMGIGRSSALVRTAATGLTAAALTPLASGMAAMDQRAPLGAGARAPIVVQGDTITLHITAAPGMDPQQIAQTVRAELDRREQAKLARARASLSDIH